MERPPLTDAPRGWLEAVVGDTSEVPDTAEFEIHMQSLEDGKHHKFRYLLGDIRQELRRRDAN